jgi:hypothetical protein
LLLKSLLSFNPIFSANRAGLVVEKESWPARGFAGDGDLLVAFVDVDILCINQNDLEERAQQVSFMKDIYARAKHVAVWLGDNNVDAQMSAVNAKTAISIIRQCAKYAYEEERIGNQGMPHVTMIVEEDSDSDLKLGRKIPQPDDIKWGAVWWFYQLPWFSRIWIIQEIREHAHATMLIDDHTGLWRDVVWAYQ